MGAHQETHKAVLAVLKRSRSPLTTKQISEKISKSSHRTHTVLTQLWSREEVECNDERQPFLWSLPRASA